MKGEFGHFGPRLRIIQPFTTKHTMLYDACRLYVARIGLPLVGAVRRFR